MEHKHNWVVVVVALTALVLSIVGLVALGVYAAQDTARANWRDMSVQLQLANVQFWRLNDKGQLTEDNKQTLIVLLLRASGAWMDGDLYEAEEYLLQANMLMGDIRLED